MPNDNGRKMGKQILKKESYEKFLEISDEIRKLAKTEFFWPKQGKRIRHISQLYMGRDTVRLSFGVDSYKTQMKLTRFLKGKVDFEVCKGDDEFWQPEASEYFYYYVHVFLLGPSTKSRYW